MYTADLNGSVEYKYKQETAIANRSCSARSGSLVGYTAVKITAHVRHPTAIDFVHDAAFLLREARSVPSCGGCLHDTNVTTFVSCVETAKGTAIAAMNANRKQYPFEYTVPFRSLKMPFSMTLNDP